jgi:hypothetical protein
MGKVSKILNLLKSPAISIGIGTLILTLIIFFAEGGHKNMNPWYIVGFVVGGGLIIYGLIKEASKEKPQNYDHKSYVARMITDSKATQLLNKLPNALKDLQQLDMELAFEQGRIKRPKSLLQNILTRLRNDLKMERIPRELPDEAIWDVVVTAVKARNLTGASANEDVRAFMLHVAGVLDAKKMGISSKRRKNRKYKLVRELQLYIATDRLNYAVNAYLSYSLGINSLLILCDSCPDEDIASIMKIFGETDTELKEERDVVLSSLLVQIRALIEKELKDDKNSAEALS